MNLKMIIIIIIITIIIINFVYISLRAADMSK
jgi:hypothetical protein